MMFRPLYLLLLFAILFGKSSESENSETTSFKNGIYFDEEGKTKIEGSGFTDTIDDTEDIDADHEGDENNFAEISGSGFDISRGNPIVQISKSPKTSKKPAIIQAISIKPELLKPTAKPGVKYSNGIYIEGEFDNNIDTKPVDPPKIEKSPDSEEEPEMVDDNNTSNEIGLMGRKTEDLPATIFAKPGILFAVIGGAIVGLLCAILLVMFIVYRMRKKDEGSYPLEEPRRSNNSNSYMRSSGKEFYA